MAVTKNDVMKFVKEVEDWVTFAQIERGIKSNEDEEDELKALLRKLVRDGYLVKNDKGNTDMYAEAQIDK